MEKNTQSKSKKINGRAKQCKKPSFSYFAGANTGEGFYNLFDQINDLERDGTLYILKGGPGTGKSTLMKTIGKAFFDLGEEIEYFYCSSDPQSLDGVRLPLHNIAIVDGTAPHVTEASMPGIKEKIINLGEFIGGSLKSHEKEISALLKKKKQAFEIAYFYLKNAANLYKCNSYILSAQNDKTNIRTISKKLLGGLELEKSGSSGSTRCLFLDAVGGDGRTSLLSQNKYSKILELPYNSVVSSLILEQLGQMITAQGNDIVQFMELLSPQTINAIYIPQADTLIVQNDNEPKKDKYIKFNDEAIAQSLRQAATAIIEAKKLHKKVEAYYIPSMDFASITRITTALIEEIGDIIS